MSAAVPPAEPPALPVLDKYAVFQQLKEVFRARFCDADLWALIEASATIIPILQPCADLQVMEMLANSNLPEGQ